MEIISKIFKIISNIFYIIIFAFAIIAFPILLGFKPLVVLSGSMEPTYKVGSIIYYHKVSNPSEIKEKDIITYKLQSDTLVTHRVIEVREDGYITKGDANNMSDINPISFDKIQGKTAKIYVPYAGYIVQFVSSNLYIVWIIIGILIIDFILSNVEFEKEDNDSKKKNIKKIEK